MPLPFITLRALRHPRRLKTLKAWLLAGMTVELRDQDRVIARFVPENDILCRVDALPKLDDRSPDEILGYDEHGLPR